MNLIPTGKKAANLVVLTTFGALLLGGCSTANKVPEVPGSAVSATDYEDTLSRGIYAVAGIGPSRLDPDTSGVPGFDANDRVEPAGQVTIGADLTKHIALEAHSADLGSAGLSPSGRINYHINGASALLYAGGNRGRFRRQGLTGFGRLGVGFLDNSAVGDVQFTQSNDTHVLFGAGLEYMTSVGLGLRAEGVVFDTDIQYAQLGLMYRTGRKKQTERPKLASVEKQQPELAAAVPAAAVTAPAPSPTDACSGLGGMLEGIVFTTDSAGLTMQSVRALDQVAGTLNECPDLFIELSAHTDGRGSEGYNEGLAGKRAQSVVDYLSALGLSRDRLIVDAVGETTPVDSNDTAEGRARNRRVDLIAR